DSRSLLRTVYNKLKDKWYVINLDVVIVLERPKLGYYKDKIRRNLADLLEVEETLVSVKAKTKEGFDAVGNMRAVEAYAVIAIGRKVEHV
ncbi:MAG: 2-C-methyl-D-erythritol 2,4-cyclodiphosphate synthase, partial [candidate division WOR-3 bacterium]